LKDGEADVAIVCGGGDAAERDLVPGEEGAACAAVGGGGAAEAVRGVPGFRIVDLAGVSAEIDVAVDGVVVGNGGGDGG